MSDYLTKVLHALAKPIVGLTRPADRTFWLFLVGAVALSTVVWFVKLRRRATWFAFLFPRAIWGHPSAVLDYKLAFARAGIDAALFTPFAVSSIAVAMFVAARLRLSFGPAPVTDASRLLVALLFTVAALLAEDFGRFLVHYAAHRVPVLWELHKLHHSAEVMTPWTLHRTHPIEGCVMRGGAALFVGVMGGVFVWAFPGKVSGWTILGVDALGFVWNATVSNLRHSHVWISFGRIGEHLFISPAQHQIHHSDRPDHHHMNMGSTFAFWDWLFGTLYVTRGFERLRFGLPPSERNHEDTVLSALFGPMAAAGRRLLAPIERAAPFLRRRPPALVRSDPPEHGTAEGPKRRAGVGAAPSTRQCVAQDLP